MSKIPNQFHYSSQKQRFKTEPRSKAKIHPKLYLISVAATYSFSHNWGEFKCVVFCPGFFKSEPSSIEITSVPKVGRPDHVENFDVHSGPWTPASKIATLQTRACMWPQLGGLINLWLFKGSEGSASAHLQKYFNFDRAQQFVVCLMGELLVPHQAEFRSRSILCWAVSGSLLSKPPLSCTSRHSLGYCFHLNHGDIITPFPQDCPSVAVLSWEH